MKMNESNGSDTILVGDLSEKAFGIIANGKMFNILSSKIYSDKIAAPIRELSCNAYDAHVAANKKDIPFNVHIPTYDNPIFYIEDFGIGMDARDIEELYSTYGASTKTESNKFVGCLGLGSKSPFAYTDNFTVVSRKDGKQYHYACMVENGIPKLIKFNEEETDLPNGVKVEFNVKRNDVWDFQFKADRIFKYFTPFPNFVNYQVPKGESLTFEKDIARISEGGHYVLMGNVLYSYDDTIFYNVKENDKPMFNQFRRFGTILNARIGEVEIAVSREHLELKPKTIEYILTKHKEYAKHILENFKSTKSSYTSTLEYIKAYGKFIKKNSFVDKTDFKNVVKEFKITFDGSVEYVKVRSTSSNTPERISGKIKEAITASEYEYEYEKRFIFVSEGRIQSSAGINNWVSGRQDKDIVREAILFNSTDLKEALEAHNIKVYNKKDFAINLPKTQSESRPKNLQGLSVIIKKSTMLGGMKPVVATNSTLEEIEKRDRVFYVKTSYGVVDQKYFDSIDSVISSDFYYLMDTQNLFVIGVNKERFEEIKNNPKYVDFIEYINDNYGKNSQNYKKYCECYNGEFVRENYGILTLLNAKCLPKEFDVLKDAASITKEQILNVGNIKSLNFYRRESCEIRKFASQAKEWLIENYPMLNFVNLSGSQYHWKNYRENELRFINEYIETVNPKNQKGE